MCQDKMSHFIWSYFRGYPIIIVWLMKACPSNDRDLPKKYHFSILQNIRLERQIFKLGQELDLITTRLNVYS